MKKKKFIYHFNYTDYSKGDMKMHNQQIKQQFLSKVSSPEAYRQLFIMSQKLEQQYNKDLYNFTVHEVKDLYARIKPTTEQHAESIFKLLDQYTTWSINEGLRISNVTPFTAFMEDWSHQFIYK